MCRRLGPTPGLFEWGLLPLALFDMGTLDVADVRFYVSGAALLQGGDSVHVVLRLMSDELTDRWLRVCCCIVLCLRSLRVRELFPQPLFQLVCLIGNTQRTVMVYHISGAIASIVTLDSPGMVVLDTSAVPMSSDYEHVITTQNRHGCYLGEPRTVFGYLYQTTERLHGGSMTPPSWIWMI